MIPSNKVQKLLSSYRGDTSLQRSFSPSVVEAFIDDFKSEKKEYSVVVFLDIAGFSNKVENLTPEETRNFLDEYYKLVIPIITDRGGKIDRIAGDGILFVHTNYFGGTKPQLQLQHEAWETAETIIKKLSKTRFECKAALADGELIYCKAGLARIYEDFTIVGQAITLAYRLEDHARKNQIILPEEMTIARNSREHMENADNSKDEAEWIVMPPVIMTLKGIGSIETYIQTLIKT